MDLWRLVIASIVAPSVAVALLRVWAKRLELRHVDQESDAEIGKALRDELRADAERIREELLASIERETECQQRSERLYQQLLEKDRQILELEHKLRTRPPDAFNSERAG